MSQNPHVNILLLGETGVGKSTFINAFANYLSYGTLEEAESNKLLFLIPSKFTLTDDDFNEKVIQVGSDSNEVQILGASATQNPRSYAFHLNDYTLRIIDTPGMGDARGIKYDEMNADKLLNYISELDHLDAICFFFKPNNSRLNVLFEVCTKHVLARLDKQAQNNIIFLYTNSRSSFYSPGETHGPLKKLLQDIGSKPPFAVIPYNTQNTFCFDNEAFRYLLASSQGISFDRNEKENYKKSWKQSRDTCQRLIQYILTLPKLPLIGTLTINESRRIIGKLVKPLGKMIIHVQRAIARLQEHNEDLADVNLSVEELQRKLYVPTTKFRIHTKTTSATSDAEGFTAGIGYTLPKTVSFNVGYERTRQHVNVVEEIMEPFEVRVVDKTVENQLVSERNKKEITEKQIDKTTAVINEYLTEGNVLVDAAAKFTVFLEENAIVVYRDVFEAYFVDILQRERSINGGIRDSKVVKNIEELLKVYAEKKQNVHDVSSKDIYEAMNALFKLKNGGAELKSFYDKMYDFEDNETYSINVNVINNE